MKRLIAIAAASLALAGCASEFSVPVTGVLGNQSAQGAATARMSGDGTFFVSTASGLRCEGTYDSLSRAPTIEAPVTCSDGRSGRLVITRTMNMVSGTVIGQLNDGTPGRFVFGDLTFDQAFGDGGGARIR